VAMLSASMPRLPDARTHPDPCDPPRQPYPIDPKGSSASQTIRVTQSYEKNPSHASPISTHTLNPMKTSAKTSTFITSTTGNRASPGAECLTALRRNPPAQIVSPRLFAGDPRGRPRLRGHPPAETC